MKKIVMALSFAAYSIMLANAQNRQSGVYITLNDFENNNLMYSTRATSEVNKIHFNEFIVRPFIIVKHNREKIQLFKDEIFAYRNKDKVVRTWNFVPYNFIDKGLIWIYDKEVYTEGKGIRKERKYFFSTYGKGEIIPLTIYNLKRSFPDNHLFHVLLDAQFRSDAELSNYDSFEKKFKVNHLLETTIYGISKK